MPECTFVDSGEVIRGQRILICRRCGGRLTTDPNRRIEDYHMMCSEPYQGPGTELSTLLGAIGIPACNRCHQTARKMDRHGAAWCRDHVDELAEEIQNNAKLHDKLTVRVMSKLIPRAAKSTMIRRLIIQACDVYEDREKQEVPAGRDAD